MQPTRKIDALRPNYGTGYAFQGRLYTGVEHFLVHANIAWPSFKLPSFQWDVSSFSVLCETRDPLVAEICKDFVPVLKDTLIQIQSYSKLLKWKLKQIETLFTNQKYAAPQFDEPDDSQNARTIRSTPDKIRTMTVNISNHMLQDQTDDYNVTIDDSDWARQDDKAFYLSMFIPAAGGAVSAKIRADREKILKDAIQSIATRQDVMKDAFISMRDDLVLTIDVIADTFVNTSSNIRTLHASLNDTNQQLVQQFAEVEQWIFFPGIHMRL